MIVYDAFDAKLVGTPLGHAAILERRNKEDAQSVVSVVRRALRWTRRVEDGESWEHIRPEKFSSNRARKSNPRVGFGSLPAVARATGFGSRGRVRTSRKNCLDLAFASGSDAENTGAPAGALRPWLVASRATVARSAMFLSVRHGRHPRERAFLCAPKRGGLRDCDVRCRADDTNPSPNPRVRTVRRAAGRCPGRDADRGEKNRARTGIQSEHCRFSEICRNSFASTLCRSGGEENGEILPPDAALRDARDRGGTRVPPSRVVCESSAMSQGWANVPQQVRGAPFRARAPRRHPLRFSHRGRCRERTTTRAAWTTRRDDRA